MTLTRIRYLPLPKRVTREKMGVQERPRRQWRQHRRWVRSHHCCVPGCQAIEIEFAHIRHAANSGIALKPHDRYGVPLCWNHHREQHDCGQGTFEDRHGIDLDAIAAELVRTSPDHKMRLAIAEEERLEAGRAGSFIPVYRAVEKIIEKVIKR